MSWARLDDNLHDHPKVMELSLAAVGLWTVCLTWAHRNIGKNPPGHLTAGVVRRFAGAKTAGLAAELVAAGMWEATDGGWLIHDFADYLAPGRERGTPGTPPDLSEKRRRAGSKGGQQTARAKQQLAGQQRRHLLVSPVVASNEATPEPELLLPPTAAQTSAPDTTQTIIGEWIDHCPKRPPERVLGQVAKQVRLMLAEGIDPDDVRRGIAAWQDRGLDPSTLPSVVNQVMNAQPRAPNGRAAEDRAQLQRQLARARALDLAELEAR